MLSLRRFLYLCIIITFGYFILVPSSKAIIDLDLIKNQALIDYGIEHNYRQSSVECSVYTVYAVGVIAKNIQLDIGTLWNEIPLKVSIGVHPWGLEYLLKKYGFNFTTPSVRHLNNEDKLLYLRQELSQEHPIILLGEYHKGQYQHYMTLVGFDDELDVYYFYDSLHARQDENYTIDSNGDLPGNRTLTSDELFNFWTGGGLYGFYEWYANYCEGIDIDMKYKRTQGYIEPWVLEVFYWV